MPDVTSSLHGTAFAVVLLMEFPPDVSPPGAVSSIDGMVPCAAASLLDGTVPASPMGDAGTVPSSKDAAAQGTMPSMLDTAPGGETSGGNSISSTTANAVP